MVIADELMKDVGEVDSFVGQVPLASSSVLSPSASVLSAPLTTVPSSNRVVDSTIPYSNPLSSTLGNFQSSESIPTLNYLNNPLQSSENSGSPHTWFDSTKPNSGFQSVPTSYGSHFATVQLPPSSQVDHTFTSFDNSYKVPSIQSPSPAPSSSPSPVPVTYQNPPDLSEHAKRVLSNQSPFAPTPPVVNFSKYSQPLSAASIKPTSLPPSSINPVGSSSSSSSNTYRLGHHKKFQYAQPPGLSVSTSASQIPTSCVGPPVVCPEPLSSTESPHQSSEIPFVPLSFEELPSSSIPTNSFSLPSTSFPISTNSVPCSLPSVDTTKQNSYSFTPIQTSQSATPSVASYFPSPIVAAATAMAATVAAANSPSQYQSSNGQISETNVLPSAFSNLSQAQSIYRPAYHHWFLKKEVESKVLWHPFSMSDSLALEEAFTSTEISPDTLVATDGGRYDVNILRRQRTAVYWEESPTEVRRCSWFYKGAIDSRYVPYDESIATKLEEEFKNAMSTNEWHRRVELPNGESVVFHGPNVMVHFPQASSPDAWGNTPQVATRPRVVKRGVDEFNIEDGEPATVDHLLFLVHGVGSACDLKFRSVVEVVDDFRNLSLQLVQSHFRTATEQGIANRIEVLPVSWHSTLHSEDTGIDKKLKSITLHSIPKLRHFTNDTLLDILFYTSPVFCQTIIHAVGKELNRLYELFRSRHPNFKGGISVGGHSLGSLILFDLLCHQKLPQTPPADKDKLVSIPSEESNDPDISEEVDLQEKVDSLTEAPATPTKVPPHLRRLSHRVSYVMGNAGTGQPFITYPQLNFHPKAFFAMGSPIGMFVTVRGIDALGEDFKLPTCPGFFNIFHPFDPVAYRIETLINPDISNLKPVMIPHHKGRKRMHLELKETMARVGADLKQKFLDSVKSTWNTVYQLAMFHRSDENALEQEVDKVIEEQLHQQETESCISEEPDPDVVVGKLNGGRRVDYVLQEAPLESFNEYLFALGSHVCYWESEDTMLMILKEVYNAMGISADSSVPQMSTTYERPSSGIQSSPDSSYQDSLFATPSSSMSHFIGENTNQPLGLDTPLNVSDSTSALSQSDQTNWSVGMDPTVPPSENKNLGPPPISGFVRK